ncbi:hypothetical protein M3Y96_00569600 [Aphelenchoides besseyi]|nr:hypothetical protein M3Y96_00569600 [Aphelenchoides besseyi]
MAKTVNPLWIYGLGLFAISMLLVYIYTNYTLLQDWKHYDKFVSSDTAGEGCGGLGNMLFRISSMHSIAKHLNRAACFQDSCAQEYRFELYSMIPKLQEFPLRTRCWNESGKSVRFAENAWNYESVSKLTDYENEKYVHLRTSGYLLSHRFFHHDRPEILSMFNFSAGISETVGAYAKQNNDSIKVCTHLRTGDFHDVSHPLLPTQEPFLMSAVKFLVEKISSKQSTPNVDVILFSSEFKYANEIKEKIKKLKYTNQVLIPRELNRVETLHLAARYCDYMLLSSAASTFGWWAAYLMPDQKQQNVYYNSVFFKPNHKEKAASFHEEDFFPPAWNRLVLNKEKKEVFVEDRRKPLINNKPSDYRVLFIVGHRGDPALNKLLDEEQRQFGDVIRYSAVDTYELLHVKVHAAFSWQQKFCPQARYLLKTDDDTVVDLG